MEGLRAVGAVSAVGAWAPQGAAGACRVEPSRAGPWARAGLGPGFRPHHPSGAAGPGRGCHVGPESGCLRRYIRAGAEAAVARRCHGNLHGDVVGWVPGGEARPPRAPFSRRGPRASPRFELISLPSCPCPPVPPSPKGEVSSSHPCSCTLVSPLWGWPRHQPGGCPVSVVDVSHQCDPQSSCRWARAVASGWLPAHTIAVT